MKEKLKLSLLMAIFAVAFGAVTQLNAKVFVIYDFDSYKAAIDAVNDGAGGDTIKMTANITGTNNFKWIKADVTILGDVNPDGTPKYTMSGCYFACEIKNYCIIENIKVENAQFGIYIYYDNDSPIPDGTQSSVRINNCITSNNNSYGIRIENRSNRDIYFKMTVTNCVSNFNKDCGINFYSFPDSKVQQYSTFTNCVFNNNEYQGVRLVSVKKVYLKDCIANNNELFGSLGGSGFRIEGSRDIKLDNCTASGNSGNGFDFDVYSWGHYPSWAELNNCIAENNPGSGFYGGECLKMNNCSAIGNMYGFSHFRCSFINNCLATNNSKSGFNLGGKNLITNSTASNNLTEGLEDASNGIVIFNFTSSNNKMGIRTGAASKTKIYNSISWGNNTDLYFWGGYSQNGDTTKIYNSVYGKDSSYIAPKKINCTTENPKLQGRTASGSVTENLNEIAYYALGEGSSALNLADKSLITVAKLLENLDLNLSEEADIGFNNMITEEYLMNVISHDQIGNVRAFDGERYDAGSIAGNMGEGGDNLIFSYSPKKVGNFGKSAIVFYGNKLDNSVKITIKREGESNIVAETVKTEYSETAGMYKCNATFNFNNKKIGKWDIEVNVGDTATQTIKNGLEIEKYIPAEIELGIFGPPNVGNGTWRSTIVEYENKGNVPVYIQPIIIEIITPKDVTVEVKEGWDTFHTDGAYTGKTAIIDGVEVELYVIEEVSGNLKSTFVTPAVPSIPPYGKGHLSFSTKLSVSGIANTPIHIKAYPLKPLHSANPNLNDALWNCLKTVGKMVWDVAKIPLGAIPGVGCAIQVGESLYSVATTEGSTGYKAANAAAEMGKTITECATDIIPGGAAVKTAVGMVKALSTASDLVGHATGLVECGSAIANFFGNLVGSLDPNDKIGPVSESGRTAFSDRTDFPYMINFENDPKATAPAQEVWITDQLDLNVFDINTFEAGIMKFSHTMVTEIPFEAQNHTWTVDMRPEKELITEIKLTLDKSKGIATWYFKSIDPATGELPTDALVGFLPPNDKDGAGQGFVMFNIKLKKGLPDDVVIANKASIIFDNNPPIITPEWVNKRDIVPPASTMLRPTTINENLIELKWRGVDNPGGSGVYCYDIFVKKDNGAYELFLAKTSKTSAQFTLEKEAKYAFYSIATDHAGNRESNKTRPDITIPEVNLPFDDYAVTKWDNTFLLNLRKLENDGYHVTTCKWFKNNELIGNGFSYSAGPAITDKLESGVVYYFQITTNTQDEIYSTNKLIEKQKSQLLVYPNPTTGEFIVQSSKSKVQSVNVFDIYGRMLKTGLPSVLTDGTESGTYYFDLSNFPAGVYLLRILTETETITQKIIKH